MKLAGRQSQGQLLRIQNLTCLVIVPIYRTRSDTRKQERVRPESASVA